MKRCTKCHQEKPETEFYKSRSRHKDGLHSWCMDCCKIAGQAVWRKGGSTHDAMTILAQHGIPSCVGSRAGQRWVDLLAWAVVPIEVKGARETRPGQYVWTFSPSQVTAWREDSLVMFLAWRDENVDLSKTRVFIVPDDAAILYGPDRFHSSASVVLDSEHSNSEWEQWRQFEDRYDLIEGLRTYNAGKLQFLSLPGG